MVMSAVEQKIFGPSSLQGSVKLFIFSTTFGETQYPTSHPILHLCRPCLHLLLSSPPLVLFPLYIPILLLYRRPSLSPPFPLLPPFPPSRHAQERSHHVSRRHHPLRDWLQPRHPRPRPCLRIRTVCQLRSRSRSRIRLVLASAPVLVLVHVLVLALALAHVLPVNPCRRDEMISSSSPAQLDPAVVMPPRPPPSVIVHVSSPRRTRLVHALVVAVAVAVLPSPMPSSCLPSPDRCGASASSP
jgi:hypothetical protein